MSFLPTNYEEPKSSGGGKFTKFPDGETVRLRVLSDAVTGYQYWTKENKPVSTQNHPGLTPENIRIEDSGKPSRVAHFWAFAVWHYGANEIQICQITQSTIRAALGDYLADPDYGEPQGYDLKITRSGTGLETKYSVIAAPPKSFELPTSEIKEELANINLSALFSGENPFSSGQSASSSNPKFEAFLAAYDAKPDKEKLDFARRCLTKATTEKDFELMQLIEPMTQAPS